MNIFRGRLKILSPLVLLVIGAAACLHKPAVPMRYEKDGFSFTHFSDWRIKDDKLVADGKARIITIEGPENAVMTVSKFAPDNPISLDHYAAILEKKRSENVEKNFGGVLPIRTEKAQTESTAAMIAGETRSGLSQVFSITLLGVNVPHMANLFLIERGGHKWILMTQAPSSKWIKVQPGFQKIFDSVIFAAEGEGHSKQDQE